MRIALVFCTIDDVFQRYPAGVFSLFESNPPLGLAAIGTIAKERHHAVRIFDPLLHHQDMEALLADILSFAPDLVGFACTSLNVAHSLACARILKDRYHKLVCAGGIHVTLCQEELQRQQVFDFLIIGEGEEVFRDVLCTLEQGRPLSSLHRQGFRSCGDPAPSGTAVLSTVNQPLIDRSLMDLRAYKNRGALLDEQPCYSLFSSRGCPFHCKFCSKPAYFKQYRERSIDHVLAEIHQLVDDEGAKAISFREDNFTVHPKRLEAFCRRMMEDFDGMLPWECESRAELPKTLLELMYRAGCRGIWCGVETVVPRWSRWIAKGLERKTVERFYHDCQEVGIRTGALFLFGFPEQTEEELEEDISFAQHLPTVFSAFQCLAMFPGSLLSDYYAEHPERCAPVTADTALALLPGKTAEEMIVLERRINERIRSNRLDYHD